MGNEAFPDRNPQSEFTSGEENSEFQGFSRWNSSVYSSVLTSRNPDFDLGVDFVDTFFSLNDTDFFKIVKDAAINRPCKPFLIGGIIEQLFLLGVGKKAALHDNGRDLGGAEDIILLIFLCHTPIAAIHAAFQAFLHTFRKDFAPFTAFMIKHLRPLCLRRGEGILMDTDEDIRACFIGNALPLCHIRVLTAAQCRIRITGENDLRTALLKIFRQLFCDCEVQYFFIFAACACFAGVPAAMCRVLIAQMLYVISPRLIRGFRNV